MVNQARVRVAVNGYGEMCDAANRHQSGECDAERPPYGVIATLITPSR